MLSSQEEVLGFLREFEDSSREYLRLRGLSEHEIAEAQLELQWSLLRTILLHHPVRQFPKPKTRQMTRPGRNLTSLTRQATIA